jgi:hypothetical protein
MSFKTKTIHEGTLTKKPEGRQFYFILAKEEPCNVLYWFDKKVIGYLYNI